MLNLNVGKLVNFRYLFIDLLVFEIFFNDINEFDYNFILFYLYIVNRCVWLYIFYYFVRFL